MWDLPYQLVQDFFSLNSTIVTGILNTPCGGMLLQMGTPCNGNRIGVSLHLQSLRWKWPLPFLGGEVFSLKHPLERGPDMISKKIKSIQIKSNQSWNQFKSTWPCLVMFSNGGDMYLTTPCRISVEAMSQDFAKKTAPCLLSIGKRKQHGPPKCTAVGKGSSFSGDHIHGPC